MTALDDASDTVGLLDVLEALPRDVLRHNLWLHLQGEDAPLDSLDSDDARPSTTLGRPFRLACHRTRQLADQLTRRLQVTSSEADLQAHAAFLARQESLQRLQVGAAVKWGVPADEEDEGQLENVALETLKRGGSSCRRLQHLELILLSVPSRFLGHAVQLCCPNIVKLDLNVPQLGNAFLEPLQLCLSLTKVTVTDGTRSGYDSRMDCGASVLALAKLPGLRSLSFEGDMDSASAALLFSLTQLTDLGLGRLEVHVDAGDGVRLGRLLGTMPRLANLVLPDWSTLPFSAGAQVAQDVMAHLLSLRCLTSLCAGIWSDGSFALDGTLSQLVGLTRVSYRDAAEPAPTRTGRLPLLQSLEVTDMVTGDGLHATLLPLLPLAQLREFSGNLQCTATQGFLNASADTHSDPSGSVATSMGKAAAMLAAAPRLQRIHLCIHAWSRPSSLAAAMAALLPLHARLTWVELLHFPGAAVLVLCPVLGAASRLERLELQRCQLPESGLLHLVGERLPALRRLWVCDCGGVTGNTAVALAAVRVQPLRVEWQPDLDEEQRQLFTAAARPGVTLDSFPE